MTVLLALLTVLAQQDPDSKIDEFARSIRADDDAATRVRDALLTKAGKTALREQIAMAITDAKAAAAKDALPAHFREHFDDEGRRRDGSKAWAESVLQELVAYKRDMKELAELTGAFADKIVDEVDEHAQLKKILKNEMGVHLLYMTQIRLLAGRSDSVIEKAAMTELGKVFATSEGKLVLRPEYKEREAEFLEELQSKIRPVEELAKGLAEIAERIADDDGINGRLRKSLGHSAAAAVILDQKEADRDAVLKRVREAFTERDGKLVLDEGHQEAAEKLLKSLEDAIGRLDVVRRVLDRMAERMQDDTWRALLMKDSIRLGLLKKLPQGVGSAKSVRDAWETWVRTIFTETDGTYRVQESLMDKLADGLRKFAREVREARKTADAVAKEARTRVADGEPVKEYYLSPFGAATLADSLKAKVEALQYTDEQGFQMWVERAFEKDGDAHVMRASAVKAMEQLVAKSEKIAKELRKNDIDPGDK